MFDAEIRRIAAAVYPDDLKYFQNGGLKEILRQGGAPDYSFGLRRQGEKKLSGYCLAHYNTIPRGGVDRTSLHIENFAIDGCAQGINLGAQGLVELLRRVNERQEVTTIDLYARDVTSFRAMSAHTDTLRQLGWELHHDKGKCCDIPDGEYPLDNGFFEAEGELIHHLVLTKLPQTQA